MPELTRDPVVHLRIPTELKKKLQQAADEDHRSLNGEIVKRLADSFAVDTAQRLEDVERILRDRGLFDPQLQLPTKDDSVESLAALADRLRAGIARLKHQPQKKARG